MSIKYVYVKINFSVKVSWALSAVRIGAISHKLRFQNIVFFHMPSMAIGTP